MDENENNIFKDLLFSGDKEKNDYFSINRLRN